jgi:O-antigen ligase
MTVNPKACGSFWQRGWIQAAIALLPINLLPSLILVVVGTGWWLRHNTMLLVDPLNRRVLGLVVGLIAVTALAENWPLSLAGAFNYLPFLIFFLAFSQALRSWFVLPAVVATMVISSLMISFLGLGQSLLGWHGRLQVLGIPILELSQGDRPTSVFTSANTLAVYLVIISSLAVGLLLARQWQRWSGVALGLALPLLGLTASRNGWAIACVALLVFLAARRLWIGMVAVGLLSAIPLAAALDLWGLRAVVPALLWQRLADAFDPEAAFFSSTANRLHAWQFALQMIQQRPLQGWGWQSFAARYNAQIPAPPEYLGHCHNLFLSLAAEGGIPILIGFLVIWSWILWRGWQAWRRSSYNPIMLGINTALLCYFLSGFLDVVFLDGRIHLLIWILLACANGTWLWRQQEEEGCGTQDPAAGSSGQMQG